MLAQSDPIKQLDTVIEKYSVEILLHFDYNSTTLHAYFLRVVNIT